MLQLLLVIVGSVLLSYFVIGKALLMLTGQIAPAAVVVGMLRVAHVLFVTHSYSLV